MKERKFYGLINEPCLHPKDWVLGGAQDQPPIIFPDGHGWGGFSPTDDFQKEDDGEDLNDCVTESVVNGYEYAVQRLRSVSPVTDNFLNANGYIDANNKVKFNNRIVAVGSGTDPNGGNTFTNVATFIKNFGLAPQSAYPWDNSMTKAEFYKPMSDEIKNAGKKILSILTPAFQAVKTKNIFSALSSPDDLVAALRFGCLRVSVDGEYEFTPDGLLKIPTDLRYTHSTLLEEYTDKSYFEYRDQYHRQYVKTPWNYPFGNAKLLYVVPAPAPAPVPDVPLAGQFAEVGKAIFINGLEGKFKNQWLAFNDGETYKALFGEYTNSRPRIKLDTISANVKKIIIQ